MQSEIHTSADRRVTEFVERFKGAGDGPAARECAADLHAATIRIGGWKFVYFSDNRFARIRYAPVTPYGSWRWNAYAKYV